jgi:hypothetical protein
MASGVVSWRVRWKCTISDLLLLKAMAFLLAYLNAVCTAFSSVQALSSWVLPWVTKAMSSMYLGAYSIGWVVFRVSKRGWRYRRNRIGEASDPCGMPMLIGHWISVQPSNERAVVLFARNDLTYESTAFGHPSCGMVWSR